MRYLKILVSVLAISLKILLIIESLIVHHRRKRENPSPKEPDSGVDPDTAGSSS